MIDYQNPLPVKEEPAPKKLEPVNNRIKLLRESVTLVEGAKNFLTLGETRQAIEALLYSQAITNRLLGIILTEQKANDTKTKPPSSG